MRDTAKFEQVNTSGKPRADTSQSPNTSNQKNILGKHRVEGWKEVKASGCKPKKTPSVSLPSPPPPPNDKSTELKHPVAPMASPTTAKP
ncbi:hypothetical protein BDR05DRAFT_964750, partial [Suillus weaverae]